MDFKTLLLSRLFQDVHKIEHNNWDHLRFPDDQPRKNSFLVDRAVDQLVFILNHIDKFEKTYNLFTDPYSKELMLKLLLYNILDHHHVKLPLNTADFWDKYNTVDERYILEQTQESHGKFKIHKYRVPDSGIVFYGNPLTMLTIFLIKQYFYNRAIAIQPEPGDIAIDAGSCRGDVALHFAHAVGPKGQVHAFEFVENNIQFMHKNLQENPNLAEIIRIVPKALSDKSGQKIAFVDRGSASSIVTGAGSGSDSIAETITLDEYAENNMLPSVDFIKMDIEGAEEQALSGAYNCIKKFKPKLAISLYHKPTDWFVLPERILSIEPGYRFYLDHYTIHREETVLYGIYQG